MTADITFFSDLGYHEMTNFRTGRELYCPSLPLCAGVPKTFSDATVTPAGISSNRPIRVTQVDSSITKNSD